ncbi:siderophore biosynthesis protein [Mycobacterium mantenii]|uniref:Lysine N-acyltransferase MbtK n=1 Tax=Mycobacterium mantenii TaxID=560555 RepID=A0A1X0G442_MYCNT|nr:GNAT family N-acetyltransferase [Mycobacterium mantenii]MCV7243744.1 acetyltransferase [Mycobacterium mantenii]ORB08796.1 acetyltransferase [Mycobacterium mantenii]BBY41582.1 siderophore biosynthesis protein [Mycobacterium mantenii]
MTNAGPILPRELTDLPEAVRAVPPPPIPQLPAPYGLRVADPDADAEMVSEWMSRPHLVEAWESNWPVARWRRYLQAQLEGEFSRPLIATLDGVDRAYIEIYRAAKDSIAHRYEHDPHDLGLHVAVADLDHIERGHVSFLLPHLVASVLTLDPRCRRIMFDPDHRNALARKFCERSGCAFLGEHDMANRRMALYVLPRTPGDVPRQRDT